MQKTCTSPQEFWEGNFGNKYHERNVNLVDNNIEFFHKTKIAAFESRIDSVIEFGAGSGNNIKALKYMYPNFEYTAVEINEKACEELRKIPDVNIINLPITLCGEFDLVLCKGILIHIPPEDLDDVYDTIYLSAKKYILLCEYYNPTPVMVNYRGEDNKLWKRDFAGEMLDKYPDLKLIDYGFHYHRDEHPQDDINWFLISKG